MMCVSCIAARWILFPLRPFMISCCVALYLIESVFRVEKFSARCPLPIRISVFLPWAYFSCFCCFSFSVSLFRSTKFSLLFLFAFYFRVTFCSFVGVASGLLFWLLLVLFFGFQLLMLQVSACCFGCLSMSPHWALLACMFCFGRMGPNPPVLRGLCRIM